MSAKRKEKDKAELSTPPIIINTTQGPKVIPFGGVSDAEGGSPLVIDMERMKFWSGLNAPKDPAEFEQVRKLESYQRWVADGTLQEIHSVEQIPTVANADDRLLELSASRSSMEWWLGHEKRPPVRRKLEKKIAEMKRRPTQSGD